MASKIEVGTELRASNGNKYRWLGAQWGQINPRTDKTWRMATKSIGKQLTKKAISSRTTKQATNWFTNVLKDNAYIT